MYCAVWSKDELQFREGKREGELALRVPRCDAAYSIWHVTQLRAVLANKGASLVRALWPRYRAIHAIWDESRGEVLSQYICDVCNIAPCGSRVPGRAELVSCIVQGGQQMRMCKCEASSITGSVAYQTRNKTATPSSQDSRPGPSPTNILYHLVSVAGPSSSRTWADRPSKTSAPRSQLMKHCPRVRKHATEWRARW